MPVSPDAAAAHAKAVGEVAARVELWMLQQLAELLAHGIDRDDWANETLRRIRLWRARLDQGVAGAADELAEAVSDALLGASADGYALALGDLPESLHRPPAPAAGPVADAKVLGEQLGAVLQYVPGMLEQILRDTVAAGAAEVAGGMVGRVAAAQHVLDRLLAHGITGFRDQAGRAWSLTSYVEMAVRTASARVAIDAHVDALQAAGQSLVRVSDSPRECPKCRPWEGAILSLTPVVAGVLVQSSTDPGQMMLIEPEATLAEAREDGLFHPNCTHSISLFQIGVGRPTGVTYDPEGYDAKQRQRAMERKIREWKRREALALDPAAAAKARGKVREWQAALRDHIDAHDLKRLRRREQIDFAR